MITTEGKSYLSVLDVFPSDLFGIKFTNYFALDLFSLTSVLLIFRTCVAVGGQDFCIVAASTRMSSGYSILTRDASKIMKL